MKAYFISGLGADKRVFKYISLPEEFETIYLDWIKPKSNESLRDYSLRMAEKMDMQSPFVIVGLSMGGMIASEITRHYNNAFPILISSVPASSHLPGYMRSSGRFKIHEWVPVQWLKSAAVLKRLFGLESQSDKAMLAQMIADCDESFLRWGLGAIATWRSADISFSYFHIHGNWDSILPMRYTKPTHVISKGGHLMVMNRAKEINKIIREVLTESLLESRGC